MVQNREKNTITLKTFIRLYLWLLLMLNIDSFGLVVGSQGILTTLEFFSLLNFGKDIAEREIIPSLGRNVNGVTVSPAILGNSAFPFRTWLMKPFTNAVLTPQQRYFNYKLSRERMVTEGAYRQLKGRRRILLRKCESRPEDTPRRSD